ncbi:MAG: hypothetical protein AAF340_17265 [Pseudomonadota bacterium]
MEQSTAQTELPTAMQRSAKLFSKAGKSGSGWRVDALGKIKPGESIMSHPPPEPCKAGNKGGSAFQLTEFINF